MRKLKQIAIGEKNIPNRLASDEKGALDQVIRKTGFEVDREIFRGTYYFRKKEVTGSIIYKGEYKGERAVLKLQGLKLEAEETEMIRAFERQNRSRKVHAPKIYLNERWNQKRGYGFIMEEYVDAPHIYDYPLATNGQMREWAKFYQEYRTRAITHPWIEEPKVDQLAATIQGVSIWVKNAQLEGRIGLEDYAPYVMRFYEMSSKYVRDLQPSFMHRELTSEHIFKMPDGTYRLFSNILWGYRLQWSDLSYNVWRSLLAIRDNSYTFEEMRKYVDDWVDTYKRIPVVRKDVDFERKIYYLLLERTLGIIVGDLGYGKNWGTPQGKKYLRHMVELHQQLFDHISQKLEEYGGKIEAPLYIRKV